MNTIHSLDVLDADDPRAYTRQVTTVEVDLVDVLSKMRDCNYQDAELRASCENIRTFERLVHETEDELARLPAE